MGRAGLPYVVLAAGIALTLLVSWYANLIYREKRQARFERAVEQKQGEIENTLHGYLTLVDNVSGLAAAQVSMTHRQFTQYVRALRLPENYPGLQGLGLALRLRNEQKSEAIQKVRKEGMAGFQIWPQTTASNCQPIVYIEPQNARNRLAEGFDVLSEFDQRAAVERTTLTGEPAVTPRLSRLHGRDKSGEPAFVIFAPVYRGGKDPGTIAQRRQQLLLCLYCPFVADDFFSQIERSRARPYVSFSAYDGQRAAPEDLLYRSAPGRPVSGSGSDGALRDSRRIDVAGRAWTVVFSPTERFITSGSGNPGPIFLLGGFLVSLSLFGITRTQVKARSLAEGHAARLEQSERALRETERRLARAEASSSIMTTHVGLDGRWLRVPRRLGSLLGYTEAEILDRRLKEIVDPGSFDAVWPQCERLMRGEIKTFEHRVRCLRKNGQPVWFEINCSSATDEAGRPLHLLCYLHDVTQREEAEERIRQLNLELEQRVQERTAQLEAANRELEAFSYSVSHDLRAPLRHIGGFVAMLAESADGQLSEESRGYMDRISKSIRQMGRLIDGLLGFARMGRKALRPQQVNLERLVEDTIDKLQPETRGRNVHWIRRPLPVVHADPEMLQQVLINLLANAIKYTKPRPRAEIEIGSAEETESEFTFYVRDNGVGFDRDHAGNLFGVFQRLHRDEEFEGTGIGLANVRRIIERHGGRVWADGQPNEGATFYFSLPKAA